MRAIFGATHTGRQNPVWQKEDCPESEESLRIFQSVQDSMDQDAGEERRRAISNSEVVRFMRSPGNRLCGFLGGGMD